VRDLAWAVDPRAGAGHAPRLVAEEGHGPFEDVERFVLVVVHVVRRRQPGRHRQVFHQEEVAVGRLARGSHHGRRSEELKGVVLAGVHVGLTVLCNHGVSLVEGSDRGGDPSVYPDVERVGLPLQRPRPRSASGLRMRLGRIAWSHRAFDDSEIRPGQGHRGPRGISSTQFVTEGPSMMRRVDRHEQ
jgi:hypothetical protein